MVYTTTKMATMTAACKTSMKSSFNVVLLLTLALLFIRTPSALAVDALSNEDAKIIEDTVFKGKVDSEAVEYFASLGRIAVAGFVLAILCLVGSILFFLVRCFICMSSEGQNFCPSPVNPNDKMTTEEEEQQRRFLLKAGVCVVSAGVIAGCALSIVGTVELTSALRDLKDKTLLDQVPKSLTELIKMVTEILDDAFGGLGDLEDQGLLSFDSAPLEGELDSTESAVNGMVGDAKDYVSGDINDIAEMALSAVNGAGIGVGALVAVVVLAGLLGTMNGMRGALGSAMCAAPFWLVSAFFMFALFSMGHLLLDILCSELDVVKYCSGLENPESDRECIQSYTWKTLNELLKEELGLDVASQDFGSDIWDEVAGYGNGLLDDVHDSICNNPVWDRSSIIEKPTHCLDDGGRLRFCDDYASAEVGNTDGCISSDLDFSSWKCDGVPDIVVAFEKIADNFDPGTFKSEDVVKCIEERQFIGTVMYEDLSDLVSESSKLLDSLKTGLNPFELEPVRNIMDLLVDTDCPATLDALYFLYVGFCLIGVFLVFCSIGWLLGMYWLPSPATVVPEGYNSAYEVDDNYCGDDHKYPGAIAQSQAFVPIANPA